MNRRHDPASIARMIASGAPHAPPSVEILKSELRSDSVIDTPAPKGPPDPYFIVVKWKFVVPLKRYDKFHAFLAAEEAHIAVDVAALEVGATYAGTYAEMPHGNPHQTFWAYESADAIDALKAALRAQPKSALAKNLAALAKHIEDPSIVMHRLVRARSLKGFVKAQSTKDPFVAYFAA